MLTVDHDPGVVDSQLLSGELVCPPCHGVLKRWGYGTKRIIRYGAPAVNRWVRPSRAQCGECVITHVSLPVDLVARRADATCVIAEAVEPNTVQELGHRTIAATLGRPFSTVRGWLGDFRVNAQALEFLPAPSPTMAVDALGMLSAHATVLTQIHRPESQAEPIVSLTWQQAAMLAVGPLVFSGIGWL